MSRADAFDFRPLPIQEADEDEIVIDEGPTKQNCEADITSSDDSRASRVENIPTSPLRNAHSAFSASRLSSREEEGEREGNGGDEGGLRRRVRDPIPQSELPEHVTYLLAPESNAHVYLIGTAHVSRVSVDLVQQVIHQIQPDSVLVELCRARASILTQDSGPRSGQQKRETPTFEQIYDAVRKGQTSKALHFLLARVMSSVTEDLDVNTGAEFSAAAVAAVQVRALVVLGDRPIDITLKRTLHALSTWERIKLISSLLMALLFGIRISAEEVEKIKSTDILTEMMDNLAEYFPATVQTIVKERDEYLAASLRCCPGQVIVGVVGLGHVEGIKSCWNKSIDRKALLTAPEIQNLRTTVLAVAALAGGVIVGGCVLIGGAAWGLSHWLLN